MLRPCFYEQTQFLEQANADLHAKFGIWPENYCFAYTKLIPSEARKIDAAVKEAL